MKIVSQLVGRIAAALCISIALGTTSAFAEKGGKGVKEGLGKQLWKFNVISVPPQSGWGANGNACNGARIFFEDSTGTIVWKFDPAANKDFEIYDCDGTDSSASVIVDESMEVDVGVRLLGPNNSSLNILCEEIEDQGNDDQFCVLPNPTNINKTGRTRFHKILSTVSDGAYEE